MAHPVDIKKLRFFEPNERNLEECLKKMKEQNPGLQLIVMILPVRDIDLVWSRYPCFERGGGSGTDITASHNGIANLPYPCQMFLLKVGVLTQCVRPITVSRISWMTARNILLKINGKVTGTNHILSHPDTRE